MNETKTVAVIGAGIVGLSCALWLQIKGFSVILIDPEKPGSGTSYGNACTIADYGCIPVNSPTIFKRLPSLLFSKDSPLSIDLHYALTHLPWLLSFLANCKTARVARIIRILGKLLQKTYQGLDPLIELSGSQYLLSQQGFLQVFKTEQERENVDTDIRARRDQGVDFTELDSNEVSDLEPALKLPVVKGLLFDKANHVVNPQSLSTRYFESFLARQGRYVKQRALAVEHETDSLRVILEDGETLNTDRVVIAAGAFSAQIKGTGAHRLPLDTERGYHVQYADRQSLLSRPVSWVAAGMYATPMEQGLRFAGTVEIAGLGQSMNPRNLDFLVRKSREMFDLPESPDQEWLGFRPTFPDALPVIGYSPHSEYILFAFGHHHLGLTLAGITGKLIAELLNQEEPGHKLKAFSSRRFR